MRDKEKERERGRKREGEREREREREEMESRLWTHHPGSGKWTRVYRRTSLIRECTPLGPYSRTMPRAL